MLQNSSSSSASSPLVSKVNLMKGMMMMVGLLALGTIAINAVKDDGREGAPSSFFRRRLDVATTAVEQAQVWIAM